jgi:subtilisin family serine protease
MPAVRPRSSHAVPTILALALASAALPAAVSAAQPDHVEIPEAVPDRAIIVTYETSESFRRGGRGHADVTVDGSLPEIRTKVFTITRGRERRALEALAAQAGVTSVEVDSVLTETATTPNDPHWSAYDRWAHDQVGLRSAWDITRGSSDVVIAILDSGLETSHPEFAKRVVAPWDYVGDDAIPNDPRGHGTMSSGAAAARGNNSRGVAGVCWSCRIMPLRVLDRNGTGYASDVIRGITYAADKGADVISMSFGGFAYSTAMQNAITYARKKGAVVLASAGNEGDTAKFYPGAYSGVIAVAANRPDGGRYSWSTYGGWVDLTAPGCFWTTKTGGGYGNFCGTSASTPLVAGIVGLLRAAKPGATRSTIETVIQETARPVSYVQDGRPDAMAALKALGAAGSPAYVESGGTVVIEAETADAAIARSDHAWARTTTKDGYVGAGYRSARRDVGLLLSADRTGRSPELRFRVRFSRTGTYRVYARIYAESKTSNSLHVGLDGAVRVAGLTKETSLRRWTWASRRMDGAVATIKVTSAGLHIVNVWMREDGVRLDRLVLTTSGTAPSGKGPAVSPRR